MELKANQGKELVLHVRNAIGVLAEFARLLADKGINIQAIWASVDGDDATVRMVTDDHLHAVDALREHHYKPREQSVILLRLPSKPGMLRHLSEQLARAGIDIRHVYASAPEREAACLLVLHTADDARAFVTLNSGVATAE